MNFMKNNVKGTNKKGLKLYKKRGSEKRREERKTLNKKKNLFFLFNVSSAYSKIVAILIKILIK